MVIFAAYYSVAESMVGFVSGSVADIAVEAAADNTAAEGFDSMAEVAGTIDTVVRPDYIEADTDCNTADIRGAAAGTDTDSVVEDNTAAAYISPVATLREGRLPPALAYLQALHQ